MIKSEDMCVDLNGRPEALQRGRVEDVMPLEDMDPIFENIFDIFDDIMNPAQLCQQLQAV